jgi:hypothetical protein
LDFGERRQFSIGRGGEQCSASGRWAGHAASDMETSPFDRIFLKLI